MSASDIKVICLESVAFYALVKEVVEQLQSKENNSPQWINDKEAMQILHISSKSTLQKYRDEGMIRFSQIGKKVILYDRLSIINFIDSNSRDAK